MCSDFESEASGEAGEDEEGVPRPSELEFLDSGSTLDSFDFDCHLMSFLGLRTSSNCILYHGGLPFRYEESTNRHLSNGYWKQQLEEINPRGICLRFRAE